MEKIRVLVVDDSRFARDLIGAVLTTDPEMVVVGEAANGREAVQKVHALKPDIVTMDLVMPEMDGFAAIEQIMATHAVPILVVTTRGDADAACEAVARGALDLVEKPKVDFENAREFIHKIKLLSKIKVITHLDGRFSNRREDDFRFASCTVEKSEKIVGIASSTGGPEALSRILSGLSKTFPCPVVVAQHMADGFIEGMVRWLNKVSNLPVKVAREGESLTSGVVFVSPSEKHLKITAGKKMTLMPRTSQDIYRPSCDMLLTSLAAVYGERSIGVILTGMGSDGVAGIGKIKEARGATIAQDEKSSVVFGMNKAAIESGGVDKIVPLTEVSEEMMRHVNR